MTPRWGEQFGEGVPISDPHPVTPQPLISRNYKGDVGPGEIENFMGVLLQREEEGTLTPVLTHGHVHFLWIKHANLYRILPGPPPRDPPRLGDPPVPPFFLDPRSGGHHQEERQRLLGLLLPLQGGGGELGSGPGVWGVRNTLI